MKILQLVFASIASAFCTYLSTAPFDSTLAAFLAPFLLIAITLHAPSICWAALCVFITQIPVWLVLHYWITDVAFFGWICLSLYMSAWAPCFVVILRQLEVAKCFPNFSLVFIAPILWVGLECLRGIVIFDGYPWFLSGTGVVDSFFAQIAIYGNVWSASFLVVMFAAGFANAKHTSKITWLFFMLISLSLLAISEVQIKSKPSSVSIAVIQTNVKQSNKVRWTWEQQNHNVKSIVDLTRAGVEDSPRQSDLIVWPETMLPGAGFEVNRSDFEPFVESFLPFWYWPELLKNVAKELNVPILVGTQTWIDLTIDQSKNTLQANPAEQFNSAVLVFPDSTTERYDKTFLTPFGERIPYLEYFPVLKNWFREQLGVEMLFDLSRGKRLNYLTLPIQGDSSKELTIRIGTPICFEDTVPKVVNDLVWQRGVRQVDVLINLSNDGWFGKSDSARLQHVRESRMRCIETQTPMVRVANTGLSCLIDAKGRVINYAKVGHNQALREETVFYPEVFVPRKQSRGLNIGNFVAWFSLFASILLIVGSFLKRSSSHEKHS